MNGMNGINGRRHRLSGIVLVVGVLAALLTAACSHKSPDAVIKPLPPEPEESTTTVADFSTVELARVSGRTTTTTIPIGPGGATIDGNVLGPTGPVPGATVHIERLVGDAVGVADIQSDPAGHYHMQGILGGRYRVRAFVPHPIDLAQTQPVIFFLANTEAKPLNLQVTPFTGVAVISAIAPNPPFTGEQSQLVVQVTLESVDPGGVVRGQPVPGAKVELFGTGDWQLLTDNPATTDGSGRVTFLVRCRSAGPQPLSVVVNDADNVALNVPPCVDPPPTTTTESTATTEPPTTTTTGLVPRQSTTTTTHHASTTSTTAKKSETG